MSDLAKVKELREKCLKLVLESRKELFRQKLYTLKPEIEKIRKTVRSSEAHSVMEDILHYIVDRNYDSLNVDKIDKVQSLPDLEKIHNLLCKACTDFPCN